jgi:hypothetical protein
MRSARAALLQMGYSISSVQKATAETPGYVVGTRETGWTPYSPEAAEQHTVTVTVRCSDAGAEFQAVTDEDWTRQLNFPNRFSEAVQSNVPSGERPAPRQRDEPEATGLVLRIEPQRPGQARSEFGIDLTAAGITPVKVEIRNLTDRRYGFRRAEVVLVTVEGRRQEPMSLAAAAELLSAQDPDGRLHERLGKKSIGDGELAPGARLEGFLYFAASTYRRARVVLVDLESDESEGFSVAF